MKIRRMDPNEQQLEKGDTKFTPKMNKSARPRDMIIRYGVVGHKLPLCDYSLMLQKLRFSNPAAYRKMLGIKQEDRPAPKRKRRPVKNQDQIKDFFNK